MDEEKRGIESERFKFLDVLYYIFKYIFITLAILLALAVSKPDRIDFGKWASERNIPEYNLKNLFVVELLTSANGDIAIGTFKTIYTINLHKE